jgi:hypothetical protein
VLLALGVLLPAAAPAGATAYRYWSFWELGQGGAWVYATQGPSLARPADGDVEGFRFAVSADSAHAAQPRGGHDFAAICHGTPAKSGTKRVALVLDFGTAADAPGGETPPKPRTACARVSPDATAADALAQTAPPLRYDSNALLCAIAGYPRTGCGDQVSGNGSSGAGASSAPAAHGASGAGQGPSVGIVVGGCAVVLLGAAAGWQARRRRGGR